MKNIAIFASGGGTNAENIIQHFSENPNINVSVVCVNNPKAGVIVRSHKLKVPVWVFSKRQWKDPAALLPLLNTYKVDFIVLAGFLWLVPDYIIANYKNRIVNIHPALLPKYGGKGMYGERVHQAVVENGEKQSGITIHLVNEAYDKGDIVFQAKCAVNAKDTPDEVAQKVHELEYAHFPRVIERMLNEL